MIKLTLSEAYEFVRKSLDELAMTDDLGASAYKEDKDLYEIVRSTIEEVTLDVHQQAPAVLVDGLTSRVALNNENDTDAVITEYDEENGGIVKLTMAVDTARIVSIHSSDSDIIVTELLAEDSAEAHKQNNKFLRGTPDSPRAVLLKYAEDKKPQVKYYTIKEQHKDSYMQVEYIPYPVIEDDAVWISWQLYYPVLNWLVAAVLEILNEAEKAQLWKSKFKTE